MKVLIFRDPEAGADVEDSTDFRGPLPYGPSSHAPFRNSLATMTSRQGKDGAVLILNGLPARTQLVLDAHPQAYVINDQFAGIKSLAPGWHCISWTLASEPSNEADAGGPSVEGSIRNVTLRYFESAEIAVRDLDRIHQRLVVPNSDAASSTARYRAMGVSRSYNAGTSQQLQTVVSQEVLESVQSRLLPAPEEAQQRWRKATRHLGCAGGAIGCKVVARVVGVDLESGDASTDSLASGLSGSEDPGEKVAFERTGNVGRNENGMMVWGKSQPAPSHVEVESDGEGSEDETAESTSGVVDRKRKRVENHAAEGAEESDDGVLLFTAFDLRRSWPPNAVGAELTRWSQDKSWLLRDVAARAHQGLVSEGDTKSEWYLPLLCELELAFVLFVMASNVHAWDEWKDLLSLFCRAASIIGSQSAFHLHPASIDASSTQPMDVDVEQVKVDAHVAFLDTLAAQLDLLDGDFWSNQSTAKEEQAVLKELDVLRANIARSLALAGTFEAGGGDEEGRARLVAAWRKVSHLAVSKFGWQLDRRLDEEAEIEDDIEAEEGEDAPVIVDI
ncbi:uncharacterized protein PAN0_002c1280 [Moesziomyces antarcticus]|nr:uncharacterized protein PAN0_002c1280 [Moesziomyces antarcticus]GAK63078.1 conserved hypothetical protein [Moesziomyces antarcticus]